MAIGNFILALALLIAGGVYAGLAARGRRSASCRRTTRQVPGRAALRIDRLLIACGRYGLQAAVAPRRRLRVLPHAVPGADAVDALLVQAGARVVRQVRAQRREDRPLPRRGPRLGLLRRRPHQVDLPNQGKLVDFLRDPERVFALISTDDLAALDNAFKTAKVPYSVIDASSSRFLLISNHLGAGETEQNPLRKDVWMAPTPPAGRTACGRPTSSRRGSGAFRSR